MQDPKLALIPAAQGSKFYSVLPSSGVGDFAFSRSGSATRINKDGLIETVGNGVSRLNYPMIDGEVVGCPHHILEPQRTNLNTFSDPTDAQKGSTSYASVTYQDDFYWGLGNVINNAIVFGDNSTTRYAYYSSTVASGTEYTLSVFIKMDDNSTPIPTTDFLIVLAGTSFSSGYNVESYGNNVYKVSVSGTAGASNTANGILKVASHSTKGFKISAFQVEVGSYPTSYIPTNGSTVTRSAETANGSGNSEVFNDSEGVLFANINSQTLSSGNDRVLSISDGTTNNRIFIGFRESAGGVIYSFVIVGGVAQANYNTNITSLNTYSKVTLKYKQNDFSIYVNGFKVYEDTSGSVFPSGTLSNLSFNQGISSNNFYGKTKELGYYDTALTDAELEYITSYRSLNELVTALNLNTL